MKPDYRYRMKNKTYVFHTDPGHGWLAVKKRELTELQIMHQISPYSYMKGETVYLEEDCDAAVFMRRYEQVLGKKMAYRDSYLERTPIRYYDRFQVLL